MTRQELAILRHTDYQCHGCWQDLRLLPQTRWRMIAMPAKMRGKSDEGQHLLAVCEDCAWPLAMAEEKPAPLQPMALKTFDLDREDASLTAGALGLLSGWFVAGPALAVVGLIAGVLAGYLTAKNLTA